MFKKILATAVSTIYLALPQANANTCQSLLTQNYQGPDTVYLTSKIEISNSKDNITTVPFIETGNIEKIQAFANELGPREVAVMKNSLIGGYFIIINGEVYSVMDNRGSLKKMANWMKLIRLKPAKTSAKKLDINSIDLYMDVHGDVMWNSLTGAPFVLFNIAYRMVRRPTFKGTLFNLTNEEYLDLKTKLESEQGFAFSPVLDEEQDARKLIFKGANTGALVDAGVFTGLGMSLLIWIQFFASMGG